MKYNLRKEPSKIEFLLPKSKNIGNEKPEISIVVPALNEELTIGEFVDWCWEGLKKAKVKGEIIIVDSSSDDTPNIALARGAKVLRTPKRGLGQAYIDVIPFISGDFIIMGDCDLTYDFREVKLFIDSYKKGNEFVMGSRFTGFIEDGAMPPLHRYFGTPLTTWILNRIYHSSYNDIHCGMRGLTKEAMAKINLTSKGWEYASEMVLKASRLNLKIDEVPVNFYKDRDGRYSHHKRAGFWSPWYAGWINLKVMLAYSPDSLTLKPAILSMIIGLCILLALIDGPIRIYGAGLGLYSMFLGVTFIVLGYSLFQLSIVSRIIHGLRLGVENYILKKVSYDRGSCISLFLFFCGCFLEIPFILKYVDNNFQIYEPSYSAIYGLLLIIIGIQSFSFTVLLELIRRIKKD
jgi:glycosyltransferase involved in cell wall biosynthesis